MHIRLRKFRGLRRWRNAKSVDHEGFCPFETPEATIEEPEVPSAAFDIPAAPQSEEN